MVERDLAGVIVGFAQQRGTTPDICELLAGPEATSWTRSPKRERRSR